MTHAYLPQHCAGAETMLHAMLLALSRAGHDVDVLLSTQTGDPYEVDGIRVHPRVHGQQQVFGFLLDTDVVVAHLANTPSAAALGKWNNKPVVIVSHNTFVANYKSTFAPQGQVALLVANSEWMANDISAWLDRQRPRRISARPRIIIHHPVVDPDAYATTPGDKVTLINPSVDDGPGPASTGKGGPLLHRLAQAMPDVEFLAVTGGYGAQQDFTGLANVEVVPHIPSHEMRDRVYARTRVLLVPSKYESWGRVASEALCSGIPVVAHPTPGLRENLGPAGIFVDRADTDGYVRALRALADPDAYAAASSAALARAAEHATIRVHDEEVWVDAVEALGRHPVAAGSR